MLHIQILSPDPGSIIIKKPSGCHCGNNPTLIEYLHLWSLRPDLGRIRRVWRDVTGLIRREVIVERPKLRPDYVLSYKNMNLVPKLWAIIFMAGNTLIEHIIYHMLLKAELPSIDILVGTAMVEPGRKKTNGLPGLATLRFREFYKEIRECKELLQFFLMNPAEDKWDCSSSSTISVNPLAVFVHHELFDLVRTLS